MIPYYCSADETFSADNAPGMLYRDTITAWQNRFGDGSEVPPEGVLADVTFSYVLYFHMFDCLAYSMSTRTTSSLDERSGLEH